MSEQPLQKNTHKFVSSREAAKRFGVTHDYIARLCRKGQLTGGFDNGKWLVNTASLESFFVSRGPKLPEAAGVTGSYLTAKQAARMYRVTNDYIARLCKQGKLVARRTDRTWLVEQSSLNTFFAERAAYVESPDISETVYAPQQAVRSVISPRPVTSSVITRAPRYVYVVAAVVGVMVLGASAFAVSRVGSGNGQVAGAWSGFAQAVHNFLFGKDQALVQTPTTQVVTYATTTTPTIVERKTYPVIERVVERLTTNTVSGVSQTYLDQQLNALRSQIAGVSSGSSGVVLPYAPATRIDKLSSVAITGGSISGASISGGSLSGVSLNVGDLSGAIGVANGGTGTSSAPTYGKVLLGNSSGTYDLVATSSLGIVGSGDSSAFPFTPTTNYGATANSTSTAIWFQGGLQASSTSQLGTTNLFGTLNLATTSTTTLARISGVNFLVGDRGITQSTGLGYGTLGGSASNDTAVGAFALSVDTGGDNTAVGLSSLFANTTGFQNSALGVSALQTNTTGSNNTATGYFALFRNITGHQNVAIGTEASYNNKSATNTVAVGAYAGSGSSAYSAQGYTVLGHSAGDRLGNGSDYNTLLGYQAGSNITTGYANILVGASVTANNLTTGSGNVGVGNNLFFPSASGSNQLNVGGLLFGALPATSTAFQLPTSGSLGVGTSSPFAKFAIQTNNGDTATTLFAIGSSTSSATTTLLSVSNIGVVNVNVNSTSSILTLGLRKFLSSTGAADKSVYLGLDAGAGDLSDGNPSSNVAVGYQALLINSSGSRNIAIGHLALGGNTSANDNTAVGHMSVAVNTTGTENVSFGRDSLGTNTSGSQNSAFGNNALFSNTIGSSNTALGYNASTNNSSATNTVAVGFDAGSGATTFNARGYAVLGYKAGDSFGNGADFNTLFGYQAGSAITSGFANVLVGASVTANNLTTGSGNLGFGNNLFFSSATANNQINIAGLLFGTAPATSTAFRLPTSGSLGVGTSSPFAKFAIQSNNGDTATTLFAIGSSTASATSTLFSVSNIGSTTLFQIPSSLLKTNANGTIVAAVAGTDYTTFGYLFPSNATSTTLRFDNGLISAASSTIVDGIASLQVSASGGSVVNWNGYRLNLASNSYLNLAGASPYIESSDQDSVLQLRADGSSGAVTITTASTERFRVAGTGNVGIGTTSPYRQLSVGNGAIFGGDVLAGSFTATSSASLASTTLSGNTLLTNATTTSFALTNISSGNLLKTTTGGALVAAVAGTDYTTFGYLFPNNATTTQLALSGGFTAFASSTIGAGGQATGLTISGGATTTGNAYFGGSVGIGTSSPISTLSLVTTATTGTGGYLDVTSVTSGVGLSIYNNSANMTAAGRVFKIIDQTFGSVGFEVNEFGHTGIRRFGTLDANTSLEVGTGFDSTVGLAVIANSATQSANLQEWRNSSNTALSVVTAGGGFGVGSTSPWARLSADTSSLASGVPSFVVGSSTRTDLVVTQAGYVGIGTASPSWQLTVTGTSTIGQLFAFYPYGQIQNTADGLRQGDIVLGHPSFTPAGGSRHDTSVLFWTKNGATRLSADTDGFDTGNNFYFHDYLSATTSPGVILTGTNGGKSYFSGNVGISTTTPVSTLSVQGSLCVRNTGSCGTTAGTIYATTAAITDIDLAENYPTTDMTLAAGEIAALDPELPSSIKRAGRGDTVLGIISTAPGLLLGKEITDSKPVALVGRVPVKVNLEGGPIAIGDAITISTVSGIGTRATTTAQTVGVALEPYDGTGASTIVVFVKPELTLSPVDLELVQKISATTSVESLVQGPFAAATEALKSAVSSALESIQGIAQAGVRTLGAAVYATVGMFDKVLTQTLVATDITAETVHAQTLCVGQTCVTEAELKQLLSGQAAGVGAGGSGNPASGDQASSTSVTSPTLYINGNNPATVSVGSSYSDLGATATDSEGYELTVHTFVNGVSLEPATIDTTASGTSTIDYVATDTWGNTATSTRTVIVLGNTPAPAEEPQAPVVPTDTATSTQP